MKIIIIALVLFSSVLSFSQESTEVQIRQNELSTNLLDLVAAGSLNITYERLLKNNQSLIASATLFDTFAYYDVGYIEKNSAFSLKVAYAIYFSKSKDHAGFFFYPFLKARAGEIEVEDYTIYDYNTDSSYTEYSKYDINGVAVGFGLGHKWVFNDKISLSLNGELAITLGNVDDYHIDELEARFGVNFGFRF